VHLLVSAVLVSPLYACGDDGDDERPMSAPSAAAGAPAATAGHTGSPDAAERCSAPAGVSAAPRSIAEVMTLVNALPKPLSLACFLETLARPIEMNATRSVVSAQPADGVRSPRMFLFYDPLIMSVVPAGPGSHLLEFGEQRADNTSLKGELAFPITQDALPPETPFERVMFDAERTGCAFCHRSEEPAPDIAYTRAFVSQALRPIPQDRVAVSSLSAEIASCDEAAESERCEMLRALLQPDAALERDFPSELDTFF
jgi:hypothetical protein